MERRDPKGMAGMNVLNHELQEDTSTNLIVNFSPEELNFIYTLGLGQILQWGVQQQQKQDSESSDC